MYDDRNRDYRSEGRSEGRRDSRGGSGGAGGGRGRGGPRGGGGGGGGGRPGWGGDPDQTGRGLPLSELDPALTEVSRKVIGAAIEVHKALGPGFSESVYMAALQDELSGLGVPFKTDHSVPVNYKGKPVGSTQADLFVDNRFFVDVMAERREVGGSERSALRSVLRAADLELGLIINFGERRLKDGLVRVLNPDKLNLTRHDEDGGDHDDRGSGGEAGGAGGGGYDDAGEEHRGEAG
jgi:GxxExxY protein